MTKEFDFDLTVTQKPNKNFEGGTETPVHMGKVTGHGLRQDYTYGIFYAWGCDTDEDEMLDDTGMKWGRECEWRIEFGQPGLPSVCCRSDHKMAQRIVRAIIIAHEVGRDIGEQN